MREPVQGCDVLVGQPDQVGASREVSRARIDDRLCKTPVGGPGPPAGCMLFQTLNILSREVCVCVVDM